MASRETDAGDPRDLPYLTAGTWPDGADRPGRFSAMVLRGGRGGEIERIALIGTPDDTGVGMNHGRIGAREGPTAFRAALGRYGAGEPAGGIEGSAEYVGVRDLGDLIPGRTLDETHERLTGIVRQTAERGVLPIVIGGGHDLTFAAARGVASLRGPLRMVYMDAHLDVRAEAGSGMPMRALVESGCVSGLSVVGLDPLANSHEHAAWFARHGGEVVEAGDTAARTRLFPTGKVDASSLPVYFSLDLDAIDAAHAPGVSAMNPCGLSPSAAGAWAEAAGRCPLVAGFDIMELNPRHDEGGRTARLSAHLFLRFLRGLSESGMCQTGAGAGA